MTTKKTKAKVRKKQKTKVVPPNIRQQRVIKIVADNVGKRGKPLSLGKVLKKAGYSKHTAENPKRVTQAKSFLELLKKAMPDKKVAELQSQLMSAARLDSYKMDAKLTNKTIIKVVESVPGCKVRKILRSKYDIFATVYFWSPDGNTRKSALDMFYKLTNAYPKDKEETDTNVKIKEYLDKLSKILP